MHYLNYTRASLRLWKKRWTGVVIAVAGLAVAFGVSMLTLLYIYDGYRSDSWLPGVDKLYRVSTAPQPGNVFSKNSLSSHNLQPQFANRFNEIEASARLLRLPVVVDIDDRTIQQDWMFADAALPELFDFPMIAGSLSSAFTGPDIVVLSEASAARYGGITAVGQQISCVISDII
ncbi:MAG: ABC transporter permease [Kordiimonadaceae bacterium]|nr:ABC transporter permease [Kordiimonadaceae bacterium]